MQAKSIVALAVAFCALPVCGQGLPAIVGGGYAAPAPLTVAPGQVITAFVAGIGSGITRRVAATAYPLPTELGGISATFTQYYYPTTIPVPLFAVFPVSSCDGQVIGTACSTLLGVTLQIPYEMQPNIPGIFTPPNVALISISDGTNSSGTLLLNPVSDRIHTLRYGDLIVPYAGNTPLVTHADGSMVSADSPAQIGEVLVMYLVGLGNLGKLSPVAKTGQPSPSPAVGFAGTPLLFDYRPNATPSTMFLDSFVSGPRGSLILDSSLFTGLTPGSVGLYQINFRVPAPLSTVSPCGGAVNSNLTVDVVGSIGFVSNSFDGAEICVATGAGH